MTVQCDIAVIGAGPGGYVAALRSAQLGARTVVVEKDRIGGVCLNWGCIPTKTLLRSAEVLQMARDARVYGVQVGEATLDWTAAQKRKDGVVRRLTGGVKALLQKAGVAVLEGTARLESQGRLQVTTAGGMETIEATNIIIATGSRPAELPIPGLEGPGVLTSDGALGLESLPDSILIIGAGPIGVEFATLFNACGVKTTVVEVLPRVLPTLDVDLGAEVERSLKRARVKVLTGSKVTRVERAGDRLAVHISGQATETVVEVDRVLVAVGRRPNVEGLDLEGAGIDVTRAGIKVDVAQRTSLPRLFAVGDVCGGIQLAHVAMHQGVVAAENAMGISRSMMYNAVPSCVFCWPEVATVGLSEEAARGQGYDVQVGRFPFRANGKALAHGEHDGLVKVVAEARFGQVLGVHIVGPHASDLIQEGTLALGLEATLDEFESTIHPHPTLSEAIAEAALDAKGRALHI
jgi:dihydrolipoamide dehydrogenase